MELRVIRGELILNYFAWVIGLKITRMWRPRGYLCAVSAAMVLAASKKLSLSTSTTLERMDGKAWEVPSGAVVDAPQPICGRRKGSERGGGRDSWRAENQAENGGRNFVSYLSSGCQARANTETGVRHFFHVRFHRDCCLHLYLLSSEKLSVLRLLPTKSIFFFV